MNRVCFFGAYDPGYPRNRILRQGLARCGYQVLEARASEHRAFRRYPALLTAFARAARTAEVLLVPEFRHKDMSLARLLAGHRTLVFDPLVSRHDTLVHDWGLHAEGSAQARWNRAIDAWALSSADLVLCDTWADGELFERLGTPRSRLRRVLVGAEDRFFAVGPVPSQGPVRILYVGGFLPLHGMLTVIEALARLERQADRLPEHRVTLVGTGIEFESARQRARSHGLDRVEFLGPRAYGESHRFLAEAHIVLGAFGTSEKAGRVIPHKVYQGLAAGRHVLTGDGPGIREVFEPGIHLTLVPRGDPESLALALADAIRSPERCAALGARGRERVLEVGTPERVGHSLAGALEGRLEAVR